MSILTKIRQKSDNQKRVFSFVTAGILTIAILITWLSFSNSGSSKKEVAEGDKLSSLSPMQVIKDEFSKAFSNFKDSTGSTTTISSSTIPIEVIESTSSVSTTTRNE